MEHYINLACVRPSSRTLALAYFLGMCSFLACAKKSRRRSPGPGLWSTCAGADGAAEHLLRITCLPKCAAAWVHPSLATVDLSFRPHLFIATIAAATQVSRWQSTLPPRAHNSLGVFLPLIAVNCVILAARSSCRNQLTTFPRASSSASARRRLAIAIIALVRHPRESRVLRRAGGSRGLGITFITTGLMSMAFMVFSGVQL